MAPEQWDDTHSADARADLYSLGCTLFFVLTRKAPFAEEGAKPSLMRLMKAHNEGAIPDLIALRPDVPAELNAIYRRLLAKKPEDRFQTAADVAQALEPFTRKFVVPPSGGSAKVAIIAPRDEPSATDSQSTIDAPQRNVGWDSIPTAPEPTPTGRDGIPTYDSRTTEPLSVSNVQPEGSSRGAMTATLKRTFIAVALLACVVLAVVFSQMGRGTRPADSETNPSASRGRLSPDHPTRATMSRG